MTNKFILQFSKIIWDTELISSRITIALGEFFWGAMLLWPGTIFERGIYTYMAKIANENVWGVVFLTSSLIQLIILLSDNFHSKFARYFALWNSILWICIITAMLLSAYPPPAAIGGEIALAFSSIWIYIRPFILVEGYKRASRYN